MWLGEDATAGFPLGPLGNAEPRGFDNNVTCRVKVGVVGEISADGVGFSGKM